ALFAGALGRAAAVAALVAEFAARTGLDPAAAAAAVRRAAALARTVRRAHAPSHRALLAGRAGVGTAITGVDAVAAIADGARRTTYACAGIRDAVAARAALAGRAGHAPARIGRQAGRIAGLPGAAVAVARALGLAAPVRARIGEAAGDTGAGHTALPGR